MLIPMFMLKEMSIPWPTGLSSMSIVQLRMITSARRTWMPSIFAPEIVTLSIRVPWWP